MRSLFLRIEKCQQMQDGMSKSFLSSVAFTFPTRMLINHQVYVNTMGGKMPIDISMEQQNRHKSDDDIHSC